jgi:glycine hydroxymethyltransferase
MGFRKAADASGAILIADLAQTAPLVAAGVSPSPFEHCSIVIATAQRVMAAFRSDLVFHRKNEFGKQLGGAFCEEANIPQTAAAAVAMKEAGEPEFKNFQYEVVRNMKQLADYLVGRGLTLKTGGTDHHIAQLDLKGETVDDRSIQWVLDCANITTTVGPRGLTISSPALTERGLVDRDFEQVGEFLISGVQLAKELKKRHPHETFKTAVQGDLAVGNLRKSVVAFARQFPLPRIDGTT